MASSFRIARWVRRGVIGRPRSGRLGRVAARFFLNPVSWSTRPRPPAKSVQRLIEERDAIERQEYEDKEGM